MSVDIADATETTAGNAGFAGSAGSAVTAGTADDTASTRTADFPDTASGGARPTAPAPTTIGRSVEFPLRGPVAVDVRFSPAILASDCARYQEAADGPVDPNGIAALRALGAPLTEWCSPSPPPPRHHHHSSPPPPPPHPGSLPPRLVMACNGVQSNFVSPWGWVVADGRLVRPAWAEATHPWPEETHLCGLVLDPPELAGVAQLYRCDSPAASASASPISSTAAANSAVTTAVSAASAASTSPAEEWEWRWPGDDDRCGARPLAAVVTALGGPPIVRDGVALPARALPSTWAAPGEPRQRSAPNAVLWDPATTCAAFSAVGIRRREEGDTQNAGSCDASARSARAVVAAVVVEVVFVAVYEQVSVGEMARIMVDRGVDDAVLLGGSADVQQWVRHMPRCVSRGDSDCGDGGDGGECGDDGENGMGGAVGSDDSAGGGGDGVESQIGGGSLLVGLARRGSSNPGHHRNLNCVIFVHELVPEPG